MRAAAGWSRAIQTKGSPEVLLAAKRKLLGQNTHYTVRFSVELNRLRYHARVAAKLALPKGVAQQGIVRMAGLVLIGAEAAAEDWPNAEQREYPGGGVACGNLHRLCIREIGRA